MMQPPRIATATFLAWREFLISIIQGLVITAGTLGVYQYAVMHSYNENLTRTMVFTTLVAANILLTLVNRSFYYSIFTAMAYKNILLWGVVTVTVLLLAGLLCIPFARNFFGFTALSISQLGISVAVGIGGVIWFEFYKLIKRMIHVKKPV